MAGAVIAGLGVAELPEGDIAHLRGAADAAAGVVPVEVVVVLALDQVAAPIKTNPYTFLAVVRFNASLLTAMTPFS